MRGGAVNRRPDVFAGTFTAADLMEEELPPVRWAVPGILPEGLSLLAGKPKLGKSWLALGLAVAKASGAPGEETFLLRRSSTNRYTAASERISFSAVAAVWGR